MSGCRDDPAWHGIAVYCRPDNKVSLGFLEAEQQDQSSSDVPTG